MTGQVAHSLHTGSDHGDASPAYSSAFPPLLSVAVTQTAGHWLFRVWTVATFPNEAADLPTFL